MKPRQRADRFRRRADPPFLYVFEVSRRAQGDGVQEFPHLHMVPNGVGLGSCHKSYLERERKVG
jgi:hypothetical protein